MGVSPVNDKAADRSGGAPALKGGNFASGVPSIPPGRERILIADGDPAGRQALGRALVGVAADMTLAGTLDEARARMRDASPAVVVAVHRVGFDAAYLLAAPDLAPSATRVLVTIPGAPEPTGLDLGRCLRFVGEPLEPRNLETVVREAIRIQRLEADARGLVQRVDHEMSKLQKREKLLDAVVVERNREISDAYDKLQVSSHQAIRALAEAIEARDPYTKGHCARVASYAIALARETRYPESELETLKFAAFLHDVGKIGIRDNVLLKPGPLDDDEWKHMRTHPLVGYEIAAKLDMLRPLVACIRNHHERWDGKGYPDGLTGSDIPLIARVVAIADAFDAMSTDRPYKPALTLDESCAAFRKQRAVMYDPQLTDLFIERVIGALRVA